MTTQTPAGATGEPIDPDGDPTMLAAKNPQATGAPRKGVDGAATAVPVQDDPEDRHDPDADPEMLGSGS